MIYVNSGAGKGLHNFTLSELIAEYKKVNGESGRMVMNAVELNVLDLKRDEINSKLKEHEDYISEIAKEFIKRFA